MIDLTGVVGPRQVEPPKLHIGIAVDESLSMKGLRNGVIRGYNEFMTALRQLSPAHCAVSTVHFADRPRKVLQRHPLEFVQRLTHAAYRPGGNTALYDAIAEVITLLDEPAERPDPRLVVVLTDGADNRSSGQMRVVTDAIYRRQGRGNWSFLYVYMCERSTPRVLMVAALAAGAQLGFAEHNRVLYLAEDPEAGLRLFRQLAVVTNALRLRVGVGERQTMEFGRDLLAVRQGG